MNRLIDVHTHLFNGHYVPIEEIVCSWTPFTRPTAIALGRVIKALVGSSVLKHDPDGTGWFGLRGDAATPEAVAHALVDVIKRQMRTDKEINRLKDPGSGEQEPGLGVLLTQFAEADAAEEEDGDFNIDKFNADMMVAFADLTDETDELVRRRTLSSLLGLFKGMIIRGLKKNKGQGVNFILKMLSDDTMLANHLLKRNYVPADMPSLTIHLMMDIYPVFQEHRRPAPSIPPTHVFNSTQIERSAKFITRSGGRLLGFVAFDPRRGADGLALCRKARKKGHIGIKLYPPMDFMPNDFDRFPVLAELYQWCCDEDIPILSHCTPQGFEAFSGTGINSDPLYWEKVLRQDRFKGLRLCFGHAGGGDYDAVPDETMTGEVTPGWAGETRPVDGWYSKQKDWKSPGYPCYPRTVVELCRAYENVYCDMSYLHAIMHGGTRKQRFLTNFKHAMSAKGKLKFFDKVMFGTDWHMMEMVGQTQEYLETFRAIFADHDWLDQGMADKFFFRNAVRFLNLREFIEDPATGGNGFLKPKALAHLRAVVDEADSTP